MFLLPTCFLCTCYVHELLKVKRLTQGHSTSSWSKDFNLHNLMACPSLSHQYLPSDKHPVVWQHPGLPGRSPLPSDLHAIRLPCDSHQTPFGNHATQIETWTYGLLTESTHLVQDLTKLGFLMSYHRKNSVRDKVIGNKWIYLEIRTLHRVWAISEDENSQPQGTGWSAFIVVQLLNCVWLFATPWTIACQAPWSSPSKNTRVACQFLLQGTFPDQASDLCLLH